MTVYVRAWTLGLLLVALAGFFLRDLASPYVIRILMFSMVYALLALALNLSLGFRGELSLGHQTFFGVGAYVAAIGSASLTLPLLLLIPIAAAFAAFFGFAIGLVALRLRGPYFVIVTLSFGMIAAVLANNMVDVTNGPMGISGIGSTPASWLGWPTPLSADVICFELLLLLLVCASWVTYSLRESKYGRAWRALYDHEDLAAAIGIRSFPLDMVALVLGAGICGAAGAVYAFYTSVVAPDDVFSFNIVVAMLVAVVIGGRGRIVGPIVGAFVFSFAPEYLRFAQSWRLPIFGAALVILVMLAPQGLVPLIGGFIKERLARVREGASP